MAYETIPIQGTFGEVVAAINRNFLQSYQQAIRMFALTSIIHEDQELIRQVVGAVSVDDFEPVIGPLPETGESGKIYFVPGGGDTYTEQLWNGSQFVILATRQGNLTMDDIPIVGSERMVKSDGIARIYGVYADSDSDMVWAIGDITGRPALAIRSDGKTVFGFGIPPQIESALGSKVDVLPDKDIIDKDFADKTSTVDSGNWAYVFAGSNNKVAAGIMRDGSFWAIKFSGPCVDQLRSAMGEPLAILQKSSYVDYSEGDALLLETPQMTASVIPSNVKSVATEIELRTALSSINANTIIHLTADIALTSGLTISNKSYEITIDGHGHKLYPLGTEYSRSAYEGGMSYCSYSDSLSPADRFLDANGNALEWSWSKYYQAAGRVTDSNGNNLSWEAMGAMDCRFKLPQELQNLVIPTGNSMWINISTWFVSMEWKVLKTQKINGENYLYFRFGGHAYGIDGDYYFLQKFPTFRLFNNKRNRTGVSVENSKLYFPSRLPNVYRQGSFTPLNISSNSGKIMLTDIVFEGSSATNDVAVSKSVVMMEHCEFSHKMSGYAVGVTGDLSKQGELYANDCYFHDLYGGGINGGEYTTVKVTNSKFRDCGQNRSNFGNIYCNGVYHIDGNVIEDYGYCAIYVGIISTSIEKPTQGVVQHNIVRQTEYYDHRRTVMDSGAIYIATNNIKSVVRYNRIINYRGLGNNIGIFLDDDAYNVQVYSNMIENNPNAYAISARLAGKDRPIPSDYTYSSNRIVAQNVCDSQIQLEGNDVVPGNGNYLGTNIMLNADGAVTRHLAGQEEQILSPLSRLEGGFFRSRISLINWNM